VITGADATDAANYRCVVTNAGGSTNSNEVALTVRPSAAPDLDKDCDVDRLDLNLFLSCFSGPGTPADLGCAACDFDGDNDVDQSDFGVLQRCFSASGVPADPNCAN